MGVIGFLNSVGLLTIIIGIFLIPLLGCYLLLLGWYVLMRVREAQITRERIIRFVERQEPFTKIIVVFLIPLAGWYVSIKISEAQIAMNKAQVKSSIITGLKDYIHECYDKQGLIGNMYTLTFLSLPKDKKLDKDDIYFVPRLELILENRVRRCEKEELEELKNSGKGPEYDDKVKKNWDASKDLFKEAENFYKVSLYSQAASFYEKAFEKLYDGKIDNPRLKEAENMIKKDAFEASNMYHVFYIAILILI
ncbi:MAG: hypothetical protein HQL03_02705 [Nitrospirae bacterium]|nr:hypothetical protein [Nitrospirota bacterium]MBF0591873.1 hypothetical protein [Nitrospirota bacterium]